MASSKQILSIKWSTDKFQKFLKDFKSQCETTTPLLLKRFAADLVTRIISRTPVDTGRARFGWSGGMSDLGYTVPSSPDSQPGDAEYNVQTTPTDISITITNNVPYITYLEYGWSKQAPLGMVRISMAEVRSWGKLPDILARSYAALWAGAGASRYNMQAQIMGEGLPMVRDTSFGERGMTRPLLGAMKTRNLMSSLQKTKARHLR